MMLTHAGRGKNLKISSVDLVFHTLYFFISLLTHFFPHNTSLLDNAQILSKRYALYFAS